MLQINTIVNNRTVQKHGLQIAWAIALICLCWMLVSTGMTIYSSVQTKKANYLPQEIQPINKNRKAPYRVRQITDADLFGDATPAVAVTKAPETTLDLTLHGILWANDDAIARAIIKSGSRESNLYSIGEKIEGASAKIREIRGAEVILDRNGAAESLPLIKSDESGNSQIFTFNDDSYNDDVYNEDEDDGGHGRRESHAVSADDRAASDRGNHRDIRIKGTPAPPGESDGSARRIRKPNFSGLDRALKKLGEI